MREWIDKLSVNKVFWVAAFVVTVGMMAWGGVWTERATVEDQVQQVCDTQHNMFLTVVKGAQLGLDKEGTLDLIEETYDELGQPLKFEIESWEGVVKAVYLQVDFWRTAGPDKQLEEHEQRYMRCFKAAYLMLSQR